MSPMWLLAQSDEEYRQLLTAFTGVYLILLLAGLVLFLFVWGMIFSRAGYSFAMALLMFIPLVNVIWLLVFAFSRWPVQKELDGYRQAAYRAPPAYPPPPPRY